MEPNWIQAARLHSPVSYPLSGFCTCNNKDRLFERLHAYMTRGSWITKSSLQGIAAQFSTDEEVHGSWGQHEAHRGPTGPRWARCWPPEICYLGIGTFMSYYRSYRYLFTQPAASIKWVTIAKFSPSPKNLNCKSKHLKTCPIIDSIRWTHANGITLGYMG